MYNSLYIKKCRDNAREYNTEQLYNSPKDSAYFAGDKPSIIIPKFCQQPKNTEHKYILNEDKLLGKRNYSQFVGCFSKVPYDNIDGPLQNNLQQNSYSKNTKKLKLSAEFIYQDSLSKQEEQSNRGLFRLGGSVLDKNPESVDIEVSKNSNDSFWSELQTDSESYETISQISIVEAKIQIGIHQPEIRDYAKKILENIQSIKELTNIGISDQNTFAQRDSDDKYTMNFQFDKLVLIKDGEDAFKILVLEPLNWLENKKSEVMVNFNPGFAKISSYGCIEVTFVMSVSHLNCSTMKFVFEKVSLDDRSVASEKLLFDVPNIKNANSQQDPEKKEKTPDGSLILTKFKENDLQNVNEYQAQPKKVKPSKEAKRKFDFRKFEPGIRGKYKKIKQIRKKGRCHGLENYLMKEIKETFLNNGSLNERHLIQDVMSNYANLQQPDVNHMDIKCCLNNVMKMYDPEIHFLNNKLEKVIDNLYKESKRTSLKKLKRTNNMHWENAVNVINETIDGSVKDQTHRPSKESLQKTSLCEYQEGIGLPVIHSSTFGKTKDLSRECSDVDSEHDSIFD